MWRYLVSLEKPMVVLWCYFIWYLVMVCMYFEWNPHLWLTSLGIALIIGLALILNAQSGAVKGTRIPPWAAFRFFLIPLCVSSFAGLVKGRDFLIIFPSKWMENVLGLSVCTVFLFLVWLSKRNNIGRNEV